MKICPHCQSGNPDTAPVCVECGHSLTGAGDTGKVIEAQEERLRKRTTAFRTLHGIAAVLYVLAFAILYFRNLNAFDNLLHLLVIPLLPIIAWFQIHRPKLLFALGHWTDIRNIEEVELTDYHRISSRIVGIFLGLMALTVLILSELQ